MFENLQRSSLCSSLRHRPNDKDVQDPHAHVLISTSQKYLIVVITPFQIQRFLRLRKAYVISTIQTTTAKLVLESVRKRERQDRMKLSILVLQSALLVGFTTNLAIAKRDNSWFFVSSSATAEDDNSMLYSGLRRSLSWVNPIDDDDATTTTTKKGGATTDDDSTATADDDSTLLGGKTTTTTSTTTSLSPLAKAAVDSTSDDDSTSTSTTSSSSGSKSSSTTPTTTTSTDDDSIATAKKPSTTKTTTKSFNSTSATSAGGNSTSTTTTATKPPASNPVVEDMTLLFDDDTVMANHTSFLPSEEDQPESWPFIVTVIFLVAAATLIGTTCYKQYRKRKSYASIPAMDV